MFVPITESHIKTTISSCIPNVDIEHIKFLDTPRLQAPTAGSCHVALPDESVIVLHFTPRSMAKVLRCEEWSINSEVTLLQWLGKSLCTPRTTESTTMLLDSSVRSKSKLLPNIIQHNSSKSPNIPLSLYLPTIISSVSPTQTAYSTNTLNTSDSCDNFSIIRRARGVLLSSIPTPLTSIQQKDVDFQCGQLLRRISMIDSPTARFGPVTDVIQGISYQDNEWGPWISSSPNWSTTFRSMMEAVLRDGEDMALMTSYKSIRFQMDRFGHVLNQVTKPRLVIIDAGEEANTLVDLPNNLPACDKNTSGRKYHSVEDDDVSPPKTPDRPKSALPSTMEHVVSVTGLATWSNCIFGDPLFATVFHHKSTHEFWTGFNFSSPKDAQLSLVEDSEKETISNSNQSDPSVDEHAAQRPKAENILLKVTSHDVDHGTQYKDLEGPSCDDLIEDVDSLRVRLLLYECYHALVELVKEFQDPQIFVTREELEARKRLNQALSKLDLINSDEYIVKRKCSEESSPAKRSKLSDI